MKNKLFYLAELAACNVLTGDFNGGAFRLSDAWKVINAKLRETQATQPRPLSPNIGLLKYLLSAANNTKARFDIRDAKKINKGDGRLYEVNFRFFPRQASGVHVDQSRIYCGIDGESEPYKSEKVELGFDHVSKPLVIDDEMLRCVEEKRPEFLTDRMLEHLRTYINDLGVKVAKRVATVANGYIGRRADEASVTVKNLPLFRDPTTIAAINPMGEAILAEDALEMEMSENFNLIGGTLLDQYRKVKEIASGNDLGFDASLLEVQDAIWRDTNISQHIGGATADNILAVRSGALQFVTFNRHEGDFTYKSDKQERITMRDPFFGLLHDVIIVTEDCGDEIKRSMQFAIIWDVVGYPSCWSNDPNLDGVTDVLAYKIVCDDTPICEIDRAGGNTLDLDPVDLTCNLGNVPCNNYCCAEFVYSVEGGNLLFDASASTPAQGQTITNVSWFCAETGLSFNGAPNDPVAGLPEVSGTYAQPIIDMSTGGTITQNVTLTITGEGCGDSITKLVDLHDLRLRCLAYGRNMNGQGDVIWTDNTFLSGGTPNPLYRFTLESLLVDGVAQVLPAALDLNVPSGVVFALSEITGLSEAQNVSNYLNSLQAIADNDAKFYDNGEHYDYDPNNKITLVLKRETIQADLVTVDTTLYYYVETGTGDYWKATLEAFNAAEPSLRAPQSCVVL